MAPTMDIKEMTEAHPMNSGDGPNSYSQNSCYQRGVIDAAKAVIVQSIAENLEINRAGFVVESSRNPIIRIADFGCSTGPNTFVAMENIVESVEMKYKEANNNNIIPPEFQVFFNDHVGNDFNVLFRSLPVPPARKYMAAGVPGSFYSRLFPKNSLHIVHSSYALHWLSKVPNEVQDPNSPAWNKGNIHYFGSDKQVTMAYFGQFQNDMDIFLKARAQELVQGGLILLQLPCVPNGSLFSRTGAGVLHMLLGSSLLQLANMGVIKEESIDNFNLPQYHPTMEELEMIVEMNNYFTIEKMGTLSHPMKHLPFDVKMTSTQVRAIMEGLIQEHFGIEIVDQLFEIYTKKLNENYHVLDKEIHKDVDLFVVLKRKSD